MDWITPLVAIALCTLPWIQDSEASVCHTGCLCLKMGLAYRTYCINQNLTEIPTDIPESTSQLQLEGNTFVVITNDSFSRFPQLQSLSITHSGIEEIESLVFHGLIYLSWIDLKYNKIRMLRAHTFSGLPSLNRLELDHNSLTFIENLAFSGIGSDMLGASISLQMNPTLGVVAQRAFQDSVVETLFFSNSCLASDSLQAIKDLRNSLRLLIIENNQIPLEIPVDLFTDFTLGSLKLSHNGINDTAFLQNVHTGVLSLPGNPIGPTNFSRYPSLSSVRDLYLDNTGFYDLDISYFSTLSSLERISLENNNIVTISNKTGPLFQRLHGISLKSNPLHCNCDLKWLHAFVKRKERVFSLGAQCVTPVRKSMFKMAESEFECSAPTEVTIRELFLDGVAVLQCQTHADPYPTITWTLPNGNDVIIPSTTFQSPVIKVNLPLQSNASSGVYTCVASNHLGSHSNQKHVDVYNMMAESVANLRSTGPQTLLPFFTVFSCLCIFSTSLLCLTK